MQIDAGYTNQVNTTKVRTRPKSLLPPATLIRTIPRHMSDPEVLESAKTRLLYENADCQDIFTIFGSEMSKKSEGEEGKSVRRSMLGKMKQSAKKQKHKQKQKPGCCSDLFAYFNVFRKDRTRTRKHDEKILQLGIVKTQKQRMREIWNEMGPDQENKMSCAKLFKLCKKLGLPASMETIESSLKACNLESQTRINFDEFVRFFQKLDSKPQLHEEFLIAYLLGQDIEEAEDATIEGKVIDAAALSKFLEWSSNGAEIASTVKCEIWIYMINRNLPISALQDADNLPDYLVTITRQQTPNPRDFLNQNSQRKRRFRSRFAKKMSLDFRKSRRDGDMQETPAPSKNVLDYNGFVRFLTSAPLRHAENQDKVSLVYQDMTRPLNEYFISSSHNSYLLGNQLSGESTTYAIIRALHLAVRVIELDAWDGPNQSPIVTHGGTLCSPILFKDCLIALKDHGFVASAYPVIITIENHCSMAQQNVQVELLTSILGDALYIPETNPKFPKEGPLEWASPEALKFKFVIRDKPDKTVSAKDLKYLKQMQNYFQDALRQASVVKLSIEEEKPNIDFSSDDPVLGVPRIDTSVEERFQENESNRTSNLNDMELPQSFIVDEKRDGVVPELINLMYIKNISLPIGINKESGMTEFEWSPFRTSSSMSEHKLDKLRKPGHSAATLTSYAKFNLVRVYPGGARVMSSNYDPVPAWNCGCQIVALNYQTFGPEVWLNQAKFQDNGGCGYVLKPESMRSAMAVGRVIRKDDTSYPATSTNTTTETDELQSSAFTIPWALEPGDASYDKARHTLHIHLISGHHLPNRGADTSPYVEITLRGLQDDDDCQVSRYVENNRFDPVWRESFSFDIHNLELAIVSFTVRTYKSTFDKGKFLAQAAMPVSCLQAGYRVLPLRYANCAQIDDSYLFMKLALVQETKK